MDNGEQDDMGQTCMWDLCGQYFESDRDLKEHIIDVHIGSAKQGNLIAKFQCHCMFFKAQP
jgi:hypothetical protein